MDFGAWPPAMICISILAEIDALIDSAPSAPRRKTLKEHFDDPVGYLRGLHEARLAVLAWRNRYGINRMPGAGNLLSRQPIRASDSQMAIPAFQWWTA